MTNLFNFEKVFFSEQRKSSIYSKSKKNAKIYNNLLLLTVFLLINFKTFSQKALSISSTEGEKACLGCVPGDLKIIAGTPDIMDATTTVVNGEKNVDIETDNETISTDKLSPPLPLPPTGHQTWISLRDIAIREGLREAVSLKIQGLKAGETYEIELYTMTSVSESYTNEPKTRLDYIIKVEGNEVEESIVSSKPINEWVINKPRFTSPVDGDGELILDGKEFAKGDHVKSIYISIKENAIRRIPDSDKDSVFDEKDFDDDNDGILDVYERGCFTPKSRIPSEIVNALVPTNSTTIKSGEKYKIENNVDITTLMIENGGELYVAPNVELKVKTLINKGKLSLSDGASLIVNQSISIGEETEIEGETSSFFSELFLGVGSFITVGGDFNINRNKNSDTTSNSKIIMSPASVIEVLGNFKTELNNAFYKGYEDNRYGNAYLITKGSASSDNSKIKLSHSDSVGINWIALGAISQLKSGTALLCKNNLISTCLSLPKELLIDASKSAKTIANGLVINKCLDYNWPNFRDDVDLDRIPNYLDTDSDNDGCPDAIEGAENVLRSYLLNSEAIDVDAHGRVDIDGVPELVNSGGAADTATDQGQQVSATGNEFDASQLTIEKQPENQEIYKCDKALFTVEASIKSTKSFLVLASGTLPDYSSSSSTTKSIIYQWEVNTGNGSWSLIDNNEVYSNADTNTLTVATDQDATSGYKYRAVISSEKKECSIISSEVTLTIKDISGGTIGGDQTICPRFDGASLTSVASAQGPGSVTYTWEKSTVSDASDFTSINGANGESYNPGLISQNTWYRRKAAYSIGTNECTEFSNSVKIIVKEISAPTTSQNEQKFCENASPTISLLAVEGENIKWYSDSNAESVLTDQVKLVDGKTYYATQTVGGCESMDMLSVKVLINTLTPPSAQKLQLFCAEDEPELKDFEFQGLEQEAEIIWYDEDDNKLAPTHKLIHRTNYYARKRIGDCESEKFQVRSKIYGRLPPLGSENQTFCAKNNPTIADLSADKRPDDPEGEVTLHWYSSLEDDTELNKDTPLIDGKKYYGSYTVAGCKSITRLEVNVTVSDLQLEDDAPEEIVCSEATLSHDLTADINVVGTSFSWRAAENSMITGATTSASNSKTITDTLINTSGSDQDVVYTITPISSEGCEGDPYTYTVTVRSLPDAQVTISGRGVICEGDIASYIITGTPNSKVTYRIDKKQQTIILGASGSASISASSTITSSLELEKVEKASCVKNLSSSATITVNSLPKAILTSSHSVDSICKEENVTFTASGGDAFEFYKNGIIVQSESPDNTYDTTIFSDGDKIEVKVTSTDSGCFSISLPIIMRVNIGLDTDQDGIVDDCDSDVDGDGILNHLEDTNGDGNLNNDDADKDGTPNYLDKYNPEEDDDGDGMANKLEDANGNGNPYDDDIDKDGIPNYMDLDSDGDSIPDSTEGQKDIDGDKLPNYMDLDSDGDGMPDSTEGIGDSDGNDIPNYLDEYNLEGDDDDDGIPNDSEDTNDDGNPYNDDADNDGIPNYIDLDSDNDGILDSIEGNKDIDNDRTPNYLDLDSDGDGIKDSLEGSEDGNENDIPNFLEKYDPYGDDDGDGIANRIEDADGDGNPYNDDFDKDGIPNIFDLDSDGDGINDSVEGIGDSSGSFPPNYLDTYNPDGDADGDGMANHIEDINSNGNPYDDDTDGDGIPNYKDLDSDNDGIPDRIEENKDTDNDGHPNYVDLDSDNDGVLDLDEAGNTNLDTNRDGLIDTNDIGFKDLNSDGQADSIDMDEAPDRDSDGVPNYIDLDSDNDGINDIVEDENLNSITRIDGATDIRNKDQKSFIRGALTEIANIDSDADGYPDYLDLDSDDDGVNDVVEGGNSDSDGNGLIDGIDSDGDGILDAADQDIDSFGEPSSMYEKNTDSKDPFSGGVGVVYDSGMDSDGDGISDSEDGFDGFGDSIDANTCVIVYKNFSPNGDGFNDYLKIGCIENFPNNTIQIFTRLGRSVFKRKGYKNSMSTAFIGMSEEKGTIGQDVKLTEDTYFYILDLGDGSPVRKGWIYIDMNK